jgi:hypothetical protein
LRVDSHSANWINGWTSDYVQGSHFSTGSISATQGFEDWTVANGAITVAGRYQLSQGALHAPKRSQFLIDVFDLGLGALTHVSPGFTGLNPEREQLLDFPQ